MRGTIDSNEFIDLAGYLDPPSKTFKYTEAAGFDGHEVQELGKRFSTSRLVGRVDCASGVGAGSVVNRLATYKDLEGTLVDVVLNGQSASNVFVDRVRLMDVKEIGSAVGGLLATPSFLMTVEFVVRYSDLSWS